MRCLTRWERSAFTSTLIARPWPGFTIRGMSSCFMILDRAPSAPKRYFVRMVYVSFDRLSDIVASMIPSFCSNDTCHVINKCPQAPPSTTHKLRVKPTLEPMQSSIANKYRLQQRLGKIHGLTRTRRIIVTLTRRVIAPGINACVFLSRHTMTPPRVQHVFVRGREFQAVLFEPNVS